MKNLLEYSDYINHLDTGKGFINDFVKDIFRECYPGSTNPICKIKENVMMGGADPGSDGGVGAAKQKEDANTEEAAAPAEEAAAPAEEAAAPAEEAAAPAEEAAAPAEEAAAPAEEAAAPAEEAAAAVEEAAAAVEEPCSFDQIIKTIPSLSHSELVQILAAVVPHTDNPDENPPTD